VTKLDRLTRSVRDLATLLETYFASGRHGLISVGESVDTRSAAGRLVLNVMTSVAQWEREAIGERTSSALQHMRSEGRRVGAIPFGSALAEDGETLIPVADEQTVIATVRELRSAGLSYRAIAATLDERARVPQRSPADRRADQAHVHANRRGWRRGLGLVSLVQVDQVQGARRQLIARLARPGARDLVRVPRPWSRRNGRTFRRLRSPGARRARAVGTRGSRVTWPGVHGRRCALFR